MCFSLLKVREQFVLTWCRVGRLDRSFTEILQMLSLKSWSNDTLMEGHYTGLSRTINITSYQNKQIFSKNNL